MTLRETIRAPKWRRHDSGGVEPGPLGVVQAAPPLDALDSPAILALVTQIAIWGIWFAFNDTKNTTDTTYSVTSVSAPPLEIACDDLLEGRGPDISSEFQKLPDISQPRRSRWPNER